MQHIYTPEEYLEIEHLENELKLVDVDWKAWPKKKPKASTIRTILDYSKALEIKQSSLLPEIKQLMN